MAPHIANQAATVPSLPAQPQLEHHIAIPKSILVAAGALMLFTVAVAGTARLTGRSHVVLPPTTAVASRDLVFTDLPTGGVDIKDARTGQHVTLVQPTTGGFLRGIMRGLVREQHIDGGAVGAAFRLTRWADGRLSIADPVGGTSFELEAFGPTNEAVFANLLTDQPAADGQAVGQVVDQTGATSGARTP